MPTFGADRAPVIGDLVTDRQRLEVWCCEHTCRRERLIEPAEAVRLLGAETTFPDAARKLVCSSCGARGRDGMIRCRGSIVDYYAALEANGGMPMPTHAASGQVFPIGEGPRPAGIAHRRRRRRGG